MRNFVIKNGKLDVNDFEQGINILKSAFDQKTSALPIGKPLRAILYKHMAKDKNTISIYDENDLIGILNYKIKKQNLKITALAVCERYRGQGVGTFLMDYAKNYAQKNQCRTLSLEVIEHNDGAKRLYLKYGFKVVKKTNLYPFTKLLRQNFNYIELMQKIIK
jgi:GNAT superfamily N-acetyltransferase